METEPINYPYLHSMVQPSFDFTEVDPVEESRKHRIKIAEKELFEEKTDKYIAPIEKFLDLLSDRFGVERPPTGSKKTVIEGSTLCPPLSSPPPPTAPDDIPEANSTKENSPKVDTPKTKSETESNEKLLDTMKSLEQEVKKTRSEVSEMKSDKAEKPIIINTVQQSPFSYPYMFTPPMFAPSSPSVVQVINNPQIYDRVEKVDKDKQDKQNKQDKKQEPDNDIIGRSLAFLSALLLLAQACIIWLKTLVQSRMTGRLMTQLKT